MEPEKLIGKKVKGFKFEPSEIGHRIGYSCFMDNFIDKVGVVKKFSTYNTACIIEFDSNNSYYYPADQIEAHLVEDEIPTLSDGVMMLVSDTKIIWYKQKVIGQKNGLYYSLNEDLLNIDTWKYCEKIEPTKEEQLKAILGSEDKVSEIMELFKN